MKSYNIIDHEYHVVVLGAGGSGLRAAVGTASASGDWFAVLGPGEFMFMPIADMQGIDVEPATGNPTVEFLLFDKAA